ncbi:MAG: mechanosensitive ion channel domain-containing protein [Bacteroidales bacterium]|jgi:small conductance mechanosensitive channel
MDSIDKITTSVPGTIEWLTNMGMKYGLKLLLAIVVLVVGFRLISYVLTKTGKLMEKHRMNASLRSFLRSFTGIILKILLVISALSIAGVEMTIFIAIMTAVSAGFAFAMNGTLSNFFGGAMILSFKPFEVGDFITASSFSGTVKEIQIFFTVLTTPDNKTILIPNGGLSNNPLINYSKQINRRVDWVFGISYGDNYDDAKALILTFISNDARILKDPEPFVGLGEMGDSSVNITVRAWVETAAYWDVFFDMNEKFYKEAANHGLSIPFPQLDVHLDK